MSTINASVKDTFGSFRDFAAEKVVGVAGVEIYAVSRHSQNSDCGVDCHAVSAVIDGEERYLGEVADGDSDDMNDEIATRVNEIA